MSRKDDAAIIVDLRIVITGTRGATDCVKAIHRALHEVLNRRVMAHTADGPTVVYGVEGLEEGAPVNLPSGGTAVLRWQGLELEPEHTIQ